MRNSVHTVLVMRCRLFIHILAEMMWLFCYIWIMGSVMTGCQREPETRTELSYEVCESGQLPRELCRIIENKKDQPFRLSYQTRQYTYIVIGYGMQQRGGCLVVIEELYEQNETIHIASNLVGERGDGVHLDEVTYPYVAIRLEQKEEPIVYH